MPDQTAASLFSQSIPRNEIFISDKDKEILRQLAEKVTELSARPIEKEKKELWYRHNALEKVRPVIFCDPENGWNEIITKDQIKCTGDLGLQWEMALRKEIFWGESMGDDKVVEAVFNVPYVYTETDWGMHETVTRTQAKGSYKWDSPLENYDDLDKLHFPQINVDYDGTSELVGLAKDTIGDILEIKLKSAWWWTLGMTWTLINLRGLTQFMMDMYDHPKELHRLMSILRDGHLAKLDFLEANNLLGLNNDNTYVGSGGFGFTHELPQKNFDGTNVRTIDMWGFTESQESVGVSPEMFEEFIFPYQYPVVERFGLTCYGCCEPLDLRWNVVKRFPRLRRVSVSPWANKGKMAEYLRADYIYSMKPSPTDIALPEIDEDGIHRKLRHDLEITKGCRVEVIMKDNHTIGNNPQNVIKWCKIAKEEAEKLQL